MKPRDLVEPERLLQLVVDIVARLLQQEGDRSGAGYWLARRKKRNIAREEERARRHVHRVRRVAARARTRTRPQRARSRR